MKTINFCLFLLCIGTFSCKKTEVDTVTGPRAGWTTINFNVDYTIQFPSETYEGEGYKLRAEVSGLFSDLPTSISRKGKSYALIGATFCNPLAYPCSLIQYGDTLHTPLPKSIPYRNIEGESDRMNSQMTFGEKEKLYAVLYYEADPSSSPATYEGRLYTVAKNSGQPQYAGVVRFSEAYKQEIFDILSTLTHR